MADVLSGRVFPRLYRDSVTLMALAAGAQRMDGVLRVGAVMGTPANLAILAESGMLPADLSPAPDDLVVVVRATSAGPADAAIDAVTAALSAEDTVGEPTARSRPATVTEGLAADAALTVAAISTPGTYAPIVVEQALRQGLHVFCFSDNVDVADEIRLKALAVERRLLLMGPDCGTAILDGVPLGFANVVRPGPVAIVAASGTGAQEIACQLDAVGVGVGQIIGVGGRDLSVDVGGRMTDLALDLLAGDPSVEVVVLVSKPPAPAVADRLLTRLGALSRPAVACLLGLDDTDRPDGVVVRGTLAAGAAAAAALLGVPVRRDETSEPALDAGPGTVAAGILGLYTGGTLAGEAKVIIGRAGLTAQILDLGDDEFTAGRPHPMIDPAARAEHVVRAGDRADVGVLLVDLVLGHGAADDPATPLADAVRAARAAAAAAGRELVVIGSVCGTTGDPQGLAAQAAILADAGVRVLPSNAAAARFAVAVSTAASAPQSGSTKEDQ